MGFCLDSRVYKGLNKRIEKYAVIKFGNPTVDGSILVR